MYHYEENGQHFVSCLALPLAAAAPGARRPVFLSRRPPQSGRGAFRAASPAQLTAAQEDVSWLDSRRITPAAALPQQVRQWVENGLRAINFDHPRWREMAAWQPPAGKKRVHILAMGDVGSTIAMGLKLLGGGTPRLETDLTISVNSPDTMAKDAEYGINNGYNVLKTKVGIDPELDLARLRAVRGAAKDARIRIDANQAWTPKQAVRLLNQMQDAGLDIELVEQPVKANDLDIFP